MKSIISLTLVLALILCLAVPVPALAHRTAFMPEMATPIPTVTPVPEYTEPFIPAVTAEPTPEPTPDREPLPLEGVIIGIDPGHQQTADLDKEPVAPGSSETKYKVSAGTQGVATGIPEYVVVLDVGLKLRDALEELGATVYMTRETHDVNISNIERATMMNELGADVVLRLHLNGWLDTSTGIGAFVKTSGEGAEESHAIAQVVLDALGETTGAVIESLHFSDTYSGLNWSTVPSILLELGYMSNPQEDRLLSTPEYQDVLVQGMALGLLRYFSEDVGE